MTANLEKWFLRYGQADVKLDAAPLSKAVWVKDAHKVKYVTIHYPFHPHFKQELKIVRLHNDGVIVQLPDGTRRRVPKWMTDKEVCRRIKNSSYPYCSQSSLITLRELLSVFKDKHNKVPL